jgi:hypothetical protein
VPAARSQRPRLSSSSSGGGGGGSSSGGSNSGAEDACYLRRVDSTLSEGGGSAGAGFPHFGSDTTPPPVGLPACREPPAYLAPAPPALDPAVASALARLHAGMPLTSPRPRAPPTSGGAPPTSTTSWAPTLSWRRTCWRERKRRRGRGSGTDAPPLPRALELARGARAPPPVGHQKPRIHSHVHTHTHARPTLLPGATKGQACAKILRAAAGARACARHLSRGEEPSNPAFSSILLPYGQRAKRARMNFSRAHTRAPTRAPTTGAFIPQPSHKHAHTHASLSREFTCHP